MEDSEVRDRYRRLRLRRFSDWRMRLRADLWLAKTVSVVAAHSGGGAGGLSPDATPYFVCPVQGGAAK